MSYQKNLVEYLVKIETPLHILFYIFFFIAIIYVQLIPLKIKQLGNNTIVRILLFGALLLVCKYISYLHNIGWFVNNI